MDRQFGRSVDKHPSKQIHTHTHTHRYTCTPRIHTFTSLSPLFFSPPPIPLSQHLPHHFFFPFSSFFHIRFFRLLLHPSHPHFFLFLFLLHPPLLLPGNNYTINRKANLWYFRLKVRIVKPGTFRLSVRITKQDFKARVRIALFRHFRGCE